MKAADTITLAARSLRSNKLRTAITISIIAFGIMALIGIITAIGAMSQKMMESFSTMGANGFTLRFKERNIRFGNNREKLKLVKKNNRKERISNLDKPITEAEAETFKSYYHFPAITSISTFAGNRNFVSFQTKKTSPNVFLFGGDENYLDLNGFQLSQGRNFSAREIGDAVNVCILGADVASKLSGERPALLLNKTVRINNLNCRVIGILGSRGSSFGFSRDNLAVIGYKVLSRAFEESSFIIGVKTDDLHQVENAMGEAEGVFRGLRKLSVTEENNFITDRSNSVADKAMRSLSLLTISVTVIGLITLVGAAIGLMNIMLVAVAERTREVGIIKAIGGKSKMIHRQFLTEAVLICIIGAFCGIALGIGVGNLFALLLGTAFIIPWNWVLYGLIICTVVGLAAGLYPALKAAKLNPIEALRYE
jgi:putative ABC transport system permease protein